MVCWHVLFGVCWVSIISQSSNSSNCSQSNDIPSLYIIFPCVSGVFEISVATASSFIIKSGPPFIPRKKPAAGLRSAVVGESLELWQQISLTWIWLTKEMMVGHPATSTLCLSLKDVIFLMAHQEALILLRPVFNKGDAVSPCFTFNDHFGGCFRRYSWIDVTCRNTDLPSTWPDAHQFLSDAWWKARQRIFVDAKCCHGSFCRCKQLNCPHCTVQSQLILVWQHEFIFYAAQGAHVASRFLVRFTVWLSCQMWWLFLNLFVLSLYLTPGVASSAVPMEALGAAADWFDDAGPTYLRLDHIAEDTTVYATGTYNNNQ